MRGWRFAACLIVLVACFGGVAAAGADYAMYVWKEGFDATVPGCDEAKLLAWNKGDDGECYTHNWDDIVNRQWLWDTANRPGREIGRLFISDIKPRLQAGFLDGMNCDHSAIDDVREMLKEGHCLVPGVELYALLATSDLAVSEQNHVPFIVWYNDNCAADATERFDGVAVNNEAWNDVKCTTLPAEQDYLDNLQAITDAAALQIDGTLATHYSIGWRWSFCDSSEVTVDWDGTVQPATHHMIDIFDSVDVQVAYVDPAVVGDRALTAGYTHAATQGKPIYVLSYVNHSTSNCVTTHFPFDCTTSPWSNPTRTDDYLMGDVFDGFAVNGIPDALPAIHYFRGAYSTGAHADWPSYYAGVISTCIFETFVGELEFATPNDDDEISWPGQTNATVYELARADDDPSFGTGCRIVATTQSTSAVDHEQPAPGSLFSYLVRVLAPDPGNWGPSSTGTPRTFQCL